MLYSSNVMDHVPWIVIIKAVQYTSYDSSRRLFSMSQNYKSKNFENGLRS